jgi:hypothetical protein
MFELAQPVVGTATRAVKTACPNLHLSDRNQLLRPAIALGRSLHLDSTATLRTFASP